MIRVVLFLISVAVIAAGFVWFADRPGDVAITWMGYRIETSVMVAALAVGALVVVVMFVWSILRGILRSPEQVSLFFRHRRAMKGYLAISRGLIAIGAGDLRIARKSADEAARLSPGDPLALLLDRAIGADGRRPRRRRARVPRHEHARRHQAARPARPLHRGAAPQRYRGRAAAWREEAARAQPSLAWAGQAVLDDRCAAADWAGALARARSHEERAGESRLPPQARGAADRARAWRWRTSTATRRAPAALEAVKLAPDLVPAAALGRTAARGSRRSAQGRKNSRPRRGRSIRIPTSPRLTRICGSATRARARLTRMQTLAEKVPGQLEGALAVARAALEAREFATARAALAPYLSAPTRRVATLMARDRGGRARRRRAACANGWPAPCAPPAIRCGRRTAWCPSAGCRCRPMAGSMAIEWKVPLAEIGVSRPVIEFTDAPAARSRSSRRAGAGAARPEPAAEPPLRKVGETRRGKADKGQSRSRR